MDDWDMDGGGWGCKKEGNNEVKLLNPTIYGGLKTTPPWVPKKLHVFLKWNLQMLIAVELLPLKLQQFRTI